MDSRTTRRYDLPTYHFGTHVAEGIDYRSRHQVRITVLAGANDAPGGEEQALHSLSPTDRWTDRTAQPDRRTVPSILRQFPARRLGHVITNRVTRIQHYAHRDHESLAVLYEL